MKAPPRGVNDGIPPPGPRQSLWCKGARREVSLRLCRMDCHRQSIPTTTSGCRVFESCHAIKQEAPHLYQVRGFLFKGPQWEPKEIIAYKTLTDNALQNHAQYLVAISLYTAMAGRTLSITYLETFQCRI